MTIPFGRYRLNLTVRLTTSSDDCPDTQFPPGVDDHELARLSRLGSREVDGARWRALTLMYGGAQLHR